MVESHLLIFYGEECEICHQMDEKIFKPMEKEGFKFKRLEVWHNDANKRKMMQLTDGQCRQLPMLFNTKTSKWLCGSQGSSAVKKWAKGE
ncbi:MAG: hypothetical protein PHW96_00365 [Candidatus Nanoarchaeia archaeon]|nr:hypothetical protein [Candidatus Nanoarchaeia archaeon]